MDVIKAFQGYIDKITVDISGMKIMLLDASTTGMVSLVYTQSQMFKKEVYLLDRIENPARQSMHFLKCICFLRPTSESIEAVVRELANPCYGEYYLYFTNALKGSMIEKIAEADEKEAVKEVIECYCDYYAVNADLFSLNLPKCIGRKLDLWDGPKLQRAVEGLAAVCLSLKKRPLIRYDKNSEMACTLGKELFAFMQQERALFDFRCSANPPILLLLDRRSDLYTPLLMQWTYQAMVHELLGNTNGRVSLAHVPNLAPELREIVLNPDQDAFYAQNMYHHFGDLGANVKAYVDEFQTMNRSHVEIESLADMKRFVEEYPKFKEKSGNVAKHVTLMGEMNRMIERHALLEISELEQSLACSESHSSHYKALTAMLAKPHIALEYKIRLVLLYIVRYRRSVSFELAALTDLVRTQGATDEDLRIVAMFMKYASVEFRQDELPLAETIYLRAKTVMNGFKGIDNVYTQHSPVLQEVLDQLIKGRLKDTAYPFLDGYSRERPQEAIIFFVNGVTFEEAKTVAQRNAFHSGCRLILGGTTIHHSKSFLDEVAHSVRDIHLQSSLFTSVRF